MVLLLALQSLRLVPKKQLAANPFSQECNSVIDSAKVETAYSSQINGGASPLDELPFADPQVRWLWGCRQQWRQLPDLCALSEFTIRFGQM
jgi:hypothetical protein